MTRLWSEGQPIIVDRTNGDAPARFTWLEQTHQVENITRRWRVDVDWWRERVWRAYYKLSTDTGLLVIVYRDLLHGGWFLQRLYD